MVNKIILNLRNAVRDTDIEFPCTEKEMSEALEKIEIPDLNAPKVYVSEVVEPSGLSMLEGKTLNLDEVNYLAKLLDSLVQDERDNVYAVANYEGYDTTKELINVYYNPDSYTLVQDLKSIEQVGRQHYITIKAERYKKMYPPGTRIELLSMGSDPRPIESGTRGSVAFVDDIGTLHCDFDNGRRLGVIPGEDSFRTLTEEELLAESAQSEDEPIQRM